MSGELPKVGSRVRVTVEGTVESSIYGALTVRVGFYDTSRIIVVDPTRHEVRVERLPDPEPEWQRGDVVVDAAGKLLARDADPDHPWRWYRAYYYGEGPTWEPGYDDTFPARPLTLLVRDGVAVAS